MEIGNMTKRVEGRGGLRAYLKSQVKSLITM